LQKRGDEGDLKKRLAFEHVFEKRKYDENIGDRV